MMEGYESCDSYKCPRKSILPDDCVSEMFSPQSEGSERAGDKSVLLAAY